MWTFGKKKKKAIIPCSAATILIDSSQLFNGIQYLINSKYPHLGCQKATEWL